ncbi:hypothetical protein RHGRI_021991 [Rhododendron griersonianum]|uniref:Proton-dependent oligopeptide transport family protein n=1 Tax=Rhododendron griersonianum TaxID=479676 RepID=A0AAV6JNJ8_9ERIC|nr:hypothetical protein RHGRI_021991 [Rhododendron griersonianum]
MPTNTLVCWFIETLGIEKRPIKDYFCLCRGAAVITGHKFITETNTYCLAYTQWFVDIAVVRILITYFTDTLDKDHILPLVVATCNDATTPKIPRDASPEENTNNGSTLAVSPETPCGASPEENTNNGPTPAVSPEIPSGASPEEITNNDPTPAVSPEIPPGASPEENTNNGPTLAVFAEIPRRASPEENTNNGPTPVVSAGRRLMEQCKPLFIMIPMWTSLLVFGLVLSTGDTFFIDQGSILEPTVSIYIIVMMQKMTKYTSSFFSTLLLKHRKTKGITVGIWTAMLVSVFCCYVAWRVEIRRMRVIGEHKICKSQYYEEDVKVPMSILLLAPQFCLLGLTEGIGRKGLDLFFEVQVPDGPMEKYGSALNEAVIGIGSFLNAILVFCFKSWFGDTLNCSRLDKYYQMLMILSFVNLCYYRGFVSNYYSNKNKTKDDHQVEAAGAGVV